ncbi:alpha-ribazole phosphatase [Parabacteroides bouchesdurhonensis]|uniref:alpha-ribazole phosphatase n=1 Tax=Parabacteroides bouchesdurhonensis TaxID=1936995 RepID=UPI000C82C5F2|nr:alpha-ribazole phosphatase [Parabacteroides bouchesdurhonensis]
MEIYFIRHTSVDVPAGYAYGQTDVPLRSSFQTEAEIVKNNLQNISFDKVWCSPLSRCVKLADYCGYPDAERDERVKELNFGEWEMKSWEDISTDPRSQNWFNDWLNVRIPSGESFKDQYIRVSAFIEELKESGLERVCVFAHGGVLTCARVYAGEYDITDAFKNIPSYGEIIKLTF